MSTSTRNAAKKMWPYNLPLEKPQKLAEILFRFENSPGSILVSGAQDAIGICMPGLVRHYYDNDYWPKEFETVDSEDILDWLENHLFMVLLWPRPEGLDLLKETYINLENVKRLADAADGAWEAILQKDLNKFAEYFRESFEAQIAMFPAMINDEINEAIKNYQNEALAWKLAGAGGGGYLILLAEKHPKDAMKIKIRRRGNEL
ncbi:hypothetical protein [uncultured Draconibacterium sp.]|uniref:hypothetical protein n=1 Tax=uncultured Draconibacterium sp. TaxID=1573823 RepID=UPI003217BF05